MRKTYLAIGALALLGVLVIAGCGGGGSSSSPSGGGSTGGGVSEESNAETASSTGGRYGGGESSGAAEEGAGEESAAKPAAATSSGAVAVIETGKAGDLGTIVTDAAGMTLYDFHKDKGTTSACYGACEGAWPPVITSGDAKASGGTQGSLLGTTKRKDGTLQVTYNGHPLYTFVGDKKPGEANGNDFSQFGAQWYALEPNGEEPEDG